MHPLYKQLIAAAPARTGDGPMREMLKSRGIPVGENDEILWNFEKFLLDRNGRVVARFAPDVTPDDPRLVAAVEKELARVVQ
jgi:glutathione peroxidase